MGELVLRLVVWFVLADIAISVLAFIITAIVMLRGGWRRD